MGKLVRWLRLCDPNNLVWGYAFHTFPLVSDICFLSSQLWEKEGLNEAMSFKGRRKKKVGGRRKQVKDGGTLA